MDCCTKAQRVWGGELDQTGRQADITGQLAYKIIYCKKNPMQPSRTQRAQTRPKGANGGRREWRAAKVAEWVLQRTVGSWQPHDKVANDGDDDDDGAGTMTMQATQ